jgi:hypothetical protein
MGWVTVRLVEMICRKMNRTKTSGFFQGAQISGAAAMAFMHGAQTDRSLWAFFCWAFFLAKGESGGDNVCHPPVDGHLMLRHDGHWHFHRRLSHHQGGRHGHGQA